jgi:trehalose-phosphatase
VRTRRRHQWAKSTRGSSLASEIEVSTAAVAFERARPLLNTRSQLVASDFDGTLSRMVLDPWSAAMVPSAQRALRRLAVSPGVHVALISGRTVMDLAARARVGGISYRGDHGAEWAEAARGFRPAALRVEREGAGDAVSEMAERLKAEVPLAVAAPWLVLEDKGPALTFHFRGAPDVDGARRHVVAAVDLVDVAGVMVRTGGRRALELRPPGASSKGDALRRLIDTHAPEVVFMFGDDRNDALAFDVLRELRSSGRVNGLAIAVDGHADVTAEVAPRADLVLESPRQAARLLGLLAGAVAARG